MQKAISRRDQQYQREIEEMKRDMLGLLKQSEVDKEKLRADKDELRRQMEREEYLRRQEARAKEREVEDLRRRVAHMEQAAAKTGRTDPGAGYMQLLSHESTSNDPGSQPSARSAREGGGCVEGRERR